jgi:hypothetical protein
LPIFKTLSSVPFHTPPVQERMRRRILEYAKKHYSGKYTRIDVRFHNFITFALSFLYGSDLCRYWKLQENRPKMADFLALNQHF